MPPFGEYVSLTHTDTSARVNSPVSIMPINKTMTNEKIKMKNEKTQDRKR